MCTVTLAAVLFHKLKSSLLHILFFAFDIVLNLSYTRQQIQKLGRNVPTAYRRSVYLEFMFVSRYCVCRSALVGVKLKDINKTKPRKCAFIAY